jgi:hypothetical protein
LPTARFTGVSGGAYISTNATDNPIKFVTGTANTERARIDSSGRLLIGQSDTTGIDGEADDLVVSSPSHTGITVRSGSSHNASVYFADQDAVRQGRIEYNHVSDYMRFNTNGSEVVRIDSSGRVGVGTTNPSYLLQVAGGSLGNQFAIGDSSPRLVLDYRAPTTSTAAPTITSDGSSLYYYGKNGSTGAHVFHSGTSNSERLRIDSSGNVGIGGTPNAQLNLIAGVPTLRWTDSDTSGYSQILQSDTSFYIDADRGAAGTGALIFRTNGTNERMRLDSSGRLGLGTSAPSDRLTVSGNINLPDVNTYIKGGGHNVIQVDAAKTYLYGGTGGVQFRSSDNLTPLIDVTDDGKLGIGTTSPGSKLEVYRGTIALNANESGDTTKLSWKYQGTEYQYIQRDNATGGLAFGDNTSERMRLDSSGRLLVGTSTNLSSAGGVQIYSTSPYLIGCKADNNPTQGAVLMGMEGFSQSGAVFAEAAYVRCESGGSTSSGNHPGQIVFGTTATGTSSTERMRITKDGLVGIGTTAKLDPLNVSLAVAGNYPTTVVELQQDSTISHYAITFRNGNGLVGSITTAGSGTAFNTSSDYRLKENVVPLTGAADRLNQLQVRRFNFIADPDTTVDGFIAHEAQAVVPEAVTGTHDEADDDGNPVYQGIDQSKLVPLLTAALQEALAKIETLEQRLNDAGIA